MVAKTFLDEAALVTTVRLDFVSNTVDIRYVPLCHSGESELDADPRSERERADKTQPPVLLL